MRINNNLKQLTKNNHNIQNKSQDWSQEFTSDLDPLPLNFLKSSITSSSFSSLLSPSSLSSSSSSLPTRFAAFARRCSFTMLLTTFLCSGPANLWIISYPNRRSSRSKRVLTLALWSLII